MSGASEGDLYLDLLKKALTASLYPESGWKAIGREKDRSITLRSPKKWLRAQVRDLAARFETRSGLLLIKRVPFDDEARQVGKDWPLFGYTMIGHVRLDNIQACVEDVLRNDIPGDMVEAGTWRGGATIFMRALLKVRQVTDRNVWVADSFEGLPTPDLGNPAEIGPDFSQVKYLKVTLEEVKSNFARFGLLDNQVRFLKGWFNETLPQAPISRIAVLRLDGDLYESTKTSLYYLHPRVSPGGYVIVDDYNCWPACKKAVHDYLRENQIEVDIHPVDWTSVYWRIPQTTR
jgi:O-methyltransferase